jgi:hypothetical protein
LGFLPLRLGASELCRSAHVLPPLSPSPHANSLVIGTAVINTHTFKAARTRYSLQRGKMPLCFWHGVTRRPTSPSPCAGGRGLDAREVANSSLLYLSPPPLPLSLPHSLSLISSSLPVPPPLSVPPSLYPSLLTCRPRASRLQEVRAKTIIKRCHIPLTRVYTHTRTRTRMYTHTHTYKHTPSRRFRSLSRSRSRSRSLALSFSLQILFPF